MALAFLRSDSSIANPIVRNATTHGDMSEEAAWRLLIGGQPQYRVDFETGFVNQQDIKNKPNLLPGGLILNKDDNSSIVVTSDASDLGDSEPDGVFALSTIETTLILDFSAQPVDYVSFRDIDHQPFSPVIHFVDGTTFTFELDVTAGNGLSSEFCGIFRNDRPRIQRIEFKPPTRSNRWGLDDISYGRINQTPTDLSVSALSIDENSTPGTEIGTLSASDPDQNSTFTFALVPGLGDADNAGFAILARLSQLDPIFGDFHGLLARKCQ